MGDEFIRKSGLTGKEYNVFDCVRILNDFQARAYMNNGVSPVDVKLTNETGRLQFIYFFNKEETAELYQKWRNYDLR